MNFSLHISTIDDKLFLKFSGEFSVYSIASSQQQIDLLNLQKVHALELDLQELSYLDTAAAIFLNSLEREFATKNLTITKTSTNAEIENVLSLVKKESLPKATIPKVKKRSLIATIGEHTYANYLGFLSFMAFIGELFATKLYYLRSLKNIRFKEIAFELNESAIKALLIVSITSFLIGVVIAYQSAYQLKLYGANIFIVDMLGISIMRELAPLITAIVIAGRSGSAFTAQIGAMKITEELDAMRTMGFDPYAFLVMPRILALMIAMPLLIFVADMMAIIGGMIVANVDLGITPELFLERFSNVIDARHFFIGLLKGPFFAFLIATIGIYRGLMVKNDTQSIGVNTTKSVVESIFAVIVCDAVFSILFTNMGI